MRILLLALAILLSLVVAAGFLAERLLTDRDLEGELIRRVEADTGGRLEVDGGLGFALFPRPSLTLDAASFAAPLDDLGTIELVAERVELTIGPLALLLGEVAIEELSLIRPSARLRLQGEGSPSLTFALASLLEAIPFEGRVRVSGGTLILVGAEAEAGRTLREVDLAVSVEEPNGPLSANGSLSLALGRLAFEARLGRLSRDGTSTLQLDLASASDRAGPFEVGFSGLVAAEQPPRWQGRISATFATPGRALAVFGGAPAEPPAWLDRPVQGEGRIAAEAGRLEVTELVLTRGQATGRGSLTATLGPVPTFDLTLAVDQLVVDGEVGELASVLAVTGWLPAALSGRLDLTVDRLVLGGGTLQRARLTAALTADGAIVVEQVRASLPGGADFSFEGRAARGGEALTGALTLVSERLRPLLGWLGLEPGNLPRESLGRLAVQARVRLTRASLRLDRIESRLDASTITGSVELRPGERGRLLLALGVDRLNLDAYTPFESPGAGWEALQRLATRDLAVAAQIEALTARGLRWTDVTLEGRSGRGQLWLDRLEASGIGESEVSLSGGLNVAAGTAQTRATLVAERPALLLRRLGADPPPGLSRLVPFRLSGNIDRRGNEIALDLDGDLEQIAFALEGTTRLPVPDEAGESERGPGYDFELTANHPDYHGLIETLALTVGGRDDKDPALRPLEFRGRLRGQLGQSAGVTGSLALGATRATGEVELAQQPERHHLRLNLSLAEPRRATLLPWLGLFGLQLDPSLVAGPIVGNWPRHYLTINLLPEVDLELDLNAKGGLAGDGLELQAKLGGERLRIPRFAFRPFGGQASGEALVELDRRPPFGAIALTLEDLDAAALADWLGLPEAIVGRFDGYAEATALGLSAHDLVRGLAADVELTLRDATLSGLPTPLDPAEREAGLSSAEAEPVRLPHLVLNLEVERGIGRITAVHSDVEPPPVDVAGHVDLLLWAADLRVRLPRAGAAFRIVGPLERPQVVSQETPSDDRRPEPVPAPPE